MDLLRWKGLKGCTTVSIGGRRHGYPSVPGSSGRSTIFSPSGTRHHCRSAIDVLWYPPLNHYRYRGQLSVMGAMSWNDRRNSTSNRLLVGGTLHPSDTTRKKTKWWRKTYFLHSQRKRSGANKMCRDHLSTEHSITHPAGYPTLNSDGKKGRARTCFMAQKSWRNRHLPTSRALFTQRTVP